MANCVKCEHYAVCLKLGKPSLYGINEELGCNKHFEVVRCKDCQLSKYFEESGTRKCRTQGGLYRTVQDDDFCSYGERREGE